MGFRRRSPEGGSAGAEIERARQEAEASVETLMAEIRKSRGERFEEVRRVMAEKAEKVRNEIRERGVNEETMRELVDVLRETEYQAFSTTEINQILAVLKYYILEIDPSVRVFYQSVIDELTAVVEGRGEEE